MNKATFLSLSDHEQRALVLKEFPDFEMKAYEDTCFGIFFDVSDDEIDERVKYAEDYGTFETLRSIVPDFSDERAEEVVAGSPLKNREKSLLKRQIAEEHIDGWTGVHGWWKTCDDGDVFLVFLGHSEGQGGIRLEYLSAFEVEKKAHDWFETFEIHSYM